jgi:Tfp pilus assembly protein PilO
MDKWKALKPEQKLIIALLSLGLLAGLWYVAVIMDTDTELATVMTSLTRKTAEKAKFKDFKGAPEVEALKNRYAMVMAQIEENKKILPTEDLLAEFIHGLESDAEDAGVQIISYEPEKKVAKDYYEEIPVQMEIRGTFVQVVRFLKLMAMSGKRLTNVASIEMSVEENKNTREEKQRLFLLGQAVAERETILIAKFVTTAFTYTGAAVDPKKARMQ